MTIYDIAAVTIGGSTISGITECSFNAGAEEILLSSSGAPYNSFVAAANIKPTISFTTLDLATAIGLTGITAKAYSTAVDIYFRPRDIGGTYAASGNMKITLAKSVLVPKSINASHNAEATMQFDIVAVSADGTTSPVTITSAAAPYTPEKRNPDIWTVGTATFGALTMQVQSLALDAGITMEERGHSGTPYSQYAGAHGYNPRITVEGDNVEGISTIGSSGALSCTAAVYFRKMAQAGIRVSNITAQHIKLSATGGMLFNRGTSGSHATPASISVEYVPVWDGTNDPIVVETSQAIA